MERENIDGFWTEERIFALIKAKGKYKNVPNYSSQYAYEQIINEIGLAGLISPQDAENLWNSLVAKYNECFQSVFVSTEEDDQTWPFFRAMYDAVNAISESSPGPPEDSSSVDIMKQLPPAPLRVSVVNYYNAMQEEAAHLEEAFREGGIVTVKGIDGDEPVEEEDGEIISELLCADDCVLDDEEMSFDCYDAHDGKWTDSLIKDLILLRCTKEADIVRLGQKPVFENIVKELGMENELTASEVRKKWLNLVNMYLTVKNGQSGDVANVTNWLFYDLMDQVMGEIKKSSDLPTKVRKSPEFLWTTDVTKKFIKLRTTMHASIATKGHNAVYKDILEKLEISDKVSVGMARKKWNSILKRYQDEIATPDSSWILMREMKQVMKHFKGGNARKLKSRASPEFLWPNELTQKFIQLRTEMRTSFVEGGTQLAYIDIMEKLGVGHILNPNQLRKKWNYLISKYKELAAASGPDGQSSAPHHWPFFNDMQKAYKEIPDHLRHNSKVVRTNLENIWTKDVVKRFIQIRGSKTIDPNKKISLVFAEILEELGIADQIAPQQARKKWNYLYTKYLDLSQPDVDEFTRQSWAYYISMQEAVSSLPISQIHPNRRIGVDGEDGDEDVQKRAQKRVKQYACFLCNKTGTVLTDYFVFEQDQRLLHTQKTVVEIISQLLTKKVTNLEATTCLCAACTNLVNESDSIFHNCERIKERAQALYSSPAAEVAATERLIGVAGADCTVVEEPPPQVDEEELIVYSKRGRKRKATRIPYESIKAEPLEDEYLDDELEEEEEEARKKRVKTRRKRGRSRLKKKGRVRSTLIGRGLGETYHSTNKKKPTPLKVSKRYHCSECKCDFKKYTELISHKRESHTVIDNTSLEVEETVLEDGVITYFNKGKANNSNRSHVCHSCSQHFLRKDDLWYHQEIAHTDGKGRTKTAFKNRSYDCEECGETFLFKYKLKMHINNKHLNDVGNSANDFACGECGCKLGSLPGLTFHMRKHHKKSLSYRKTTEYLCSDCGFMAPSAKKLKEHVDAHCGASEKPQVQCEICGKTVLKVSLKMHKVKMHSDFKEQCERCGERYATKTDLLRHINVVHLGILLYTCNLCDERFPTSDSQRYHRVKVHEKPSFYCQVCGKCYKRVGELNSHIKRTHNERRKAETCQYCGKEYYDRSGLRNHLVSKHNVPPEMTYSENYLRKKRVDGLPLAKHMEKRISTTIEVNGGLEAQNLSQTHVPPMQAHPQHTTIITQHAHLDQSDTPRTLATYQDLTNSEENTLVVTEIAENGTQVEQAVLVNTLTVQPELMHHPQVAHIQAPMNMHHPMQHNIHNPGNMRVNLLYHMNMPHPGTSHLNM